jgi:hypothetical protein
MPWTLTQFLADSHINPARFGVDFLYYRAPAAPPTPRPKPTGWAVDWIAHIEANFLAGVPAPNKAITVQNFRAAAAVSLQNHLAINTAVPGIINALDAIAQQHLDNTEAGLIAGAPAPAPILPHSAEYLTPGVMCTGTPVDLQDRAVPAWVGRDAYSANHGRGGDFTYLRRRGQRLDLAFAAHGNSSGMIARAKPGIGLKELLGRARHAEDGWMARYYNDFVTAVNALQPRSALPALAGRSLWQQKATVPRVEFLLSMSPCPENAGDAQEGCCRYFAQVRAALTAANIPILIYYYRVWLADQQTRGVQSVAANGTIVNYPNRWPARG